MSAVHPLARWFIQRAARKLPLPERVETEVEWLRHFEDLPKFHLQLQHLIGVWRCAQMSAMHSAWEGTTRSKVQEFLLYAFWMASCMALFTDYRANTSFDEALPHLLGAIFFCGPALRFVLKPLDERKVD